MKQDYQLKITLHFLLASLAEQENNDQNTVLTCKRIGGGENLEFMSYIPFSKFITRLSLGSKNYSYKLKSYIFEKNNKKLENREKFYLLLPVISDIINKMFGVRGNTRQSVKGTDKKGGKLWLVN